MAKRRRPRSVKTHRLNPRRWSGEAGGVVTDDFDGAHADDGTFESLPPTIAQLGIEARAEYIRARRRLGLSEGLVQQLGVVGRYLLEEEIGRGGMGIVYRAHDPELDRPIAIKLVQAKPFAQPEKLRLRLLREAKVLAKLTHSNVVRIYDCGEYEGEVYLAMEFVEGATLRDWQAGKTRRAVLAAYEQAARGLAAAHEMGITHRDFKPDNVLMASDGRVLVGDFGLAGLAAGDDGRATRAGTKDLVVGRISATPTGTLLGTPMYMAPEQLRGEVATPRSDQFAFCVSLWEALTGSRPFEADDHAALLEQIAQGKALATALVPRRLRSRLLRGLSEDPEARFTELSELADRMLPQRRWAVLGSALVLSLVTGLVVGRELPPPEQSPEPPRECHDIEVLVDKVQENAGWGVIENELSSPELRPIYARLEHHFDRMEQRSEKLCSMDGVDAVVSRELQKRSLENLNDILDMPVELEPKALVDNILEFEREIWSAPPPRPIDTKVADLLNIVRSRKINGDFVAALRLIEEAIITAEGKHLELARTLRWKGRILALSGDYENAMEIFPIAANHADAASYDDARLDVELLIAKTAAMRLGDSERARSALERSDAIMRRLGGQWFGLRRADYEEIWASVLKNEKDCRGGEIFRHQAYALIIRYGMGDVANQARGHVNLARAYELCSSSPELERFNYEQALGLLVDMPSSPEWGQAAFSIGHWLAMNPDENEWPHAKELLEAALAKHPGVVDYALTDLVVLAVRIDSIERVRFLARRLSALLETKPPTLRPKRLDGWSALSAAYALDLDLVAFEYARSRFQLEREQESSEEVELDAARLDLSAAYSIGDEEPALSARLAGSARATLMPLPESSGRSELLEGIEQLNQ